MTSRNRTAVRGGDRIYYVSDIRPCLKAANFELHAIGIREPDAKDAAEVGDVALASPVLHQALAKDS
ncbi:MAG: hypothetical protein GEU71_18005 [Actinobacteria bacterium]|jgi:hypothetical protein|nr:hypothetical protein [Actinomycetota bacterium]